MPRALIIGGSLGGLFAGLLLRQTGFDVTVFERSAGDLSSRGAGIGTHDELFDIMRRLGIAVDESVGVPVSARICLDRNGTVIARLPFEKILSSWALVYRALRKQLPDDCYRAGMQLDEIAQGSDGVTAIFSDGSRAQGDLLVGADGLHSTVRARAFTMPGPGYAGYIAWRGGVDEQDVPVTARELIEAYGFYIPARAMVLSYLQPGAGDDCRPGKRRLNWLWYHPVGLGALREMCTDASGHHHEAGIPPPAIRRQVIDAFRADGRAMLPPQFVALIEATSAPFFQPIFDLTSSRVTAGRVALLGDAAFVARPHVGAGVSKAAMNAAWLADALSANGIEAGLAAYEKKARGFGAALVERARYIGAYMEDPPRAGLKPGPIPLMQAIGQPLREIESLKGLF